MEICSAFPRTLVLPAVPYGKHIVLKQKPDAKRHVKTKSLARLSGAGDGLVRE